MPQCDTRSENTIRKTELKHEMHVEVTKTYYNKGHQPRQCPKGHVLYEDADEDWDISLNLIEHNKTETKPLRNHQRKQAKDQKRWCQSSKNDACNEQKSVDSLPRTQNQPRIKQDSMVWFKFFSRSRTPVFYHWLVRIETGFIAMKNTLCYYHCRLHYQFVCR